MNIKETKELLQDCHSKLNFKTTYVTGSTEKPYIGNGLIILRECIKMLENIDLLTPEINELKKSILFQTYSDEQYFTASDNTKITIIVDKLKIGIEYLLRYSKQIDNPQNGLFIKLPEIQTFEDLSKVSNDLKKAIEIPVIDQNDGGYVKIETAESGSIWLIISIGSLSAVNLIGAICWSAAVIRKKKAEAKIFEEHAKTLGLKNESLQIVIDAQKIQIKNIIEAEAEEIAKGHYKLNDPEVINRLKLSLNTVNDLIDRGTQILPSSDNKETIKSFPDYSNLNLIESAIKKLQSEN
jgi:hypothetical protein